MNFEARMNTEKESAFRILSHREGSVQPMFDAPPIGPLSPSSSLLVERRDLEPTTWQSHFLEDQLLHFFVKGAVCGYFVERRSHCQDSSCPWPSGVLSSKRVAQHPMGRGDQCTFDQNTGLSNNGIGPRTSHRKVTRNRAETGGYRRPADSFVVCPGCGTSPRLF